MSKSADNTEHRFYRKTQAEQKDFLRKVIALVILLSAGIALTAYLSGMYYFIFFIALVLQLAAPFIDTPMGRKSGKLIYYSPLFIAEPERKNTIVIHGGTLFDYIFVLKRDMSGSERKKIVLALYLRGLKALTSECREFGKTDVMIRGTSHILNKRTAEKIGMRVVKKDTLQYLILIFNYPVLCLSQSYARGKLSLPDVSRIQTFEGHASEIHARRQVLETLEARLSGMVSPPY